MPKKAKRKLSRPTLPMQGHLNLRHEGRYFDLRRIFDRVNERHFRGKLRGYESSGVAAGAKGRRNTSFSARSRKKIASSGFIRCSTSLSSPVGFSNTFSITRCCIPLSRKKPMLPVGAGFTPKNSIGASGPFRAIVAPAAGKTRISRAFCARDPVDASLCEARGERLLDN